MILKSVWGWGICPPCYNDSRTHDSPLEKFQFQLFSSKTELNKQENRVYNHCEKCAVRSISEI